MRSRNRIDRYHITEQVGAGETGTVYQAWDAIGQRKVALKVLRPQLAGDPAALERFLKEARLASEVSHPNIAQIFLVRSYGNEHYIAMEYLPENLHTLIRDRGRLPVERAAEICRQAAQAVESASDMGVAHLDIKPQNLLLDSDGGVKVTDFGISQAAALSTLPNTGALAGTLHYMSPEQLQGHPVDVRSDIYSLGVVLYQMLSGRLPFEGSTPSETKRRHIQEKPTSLHQLHGDVPESLERIVQRCLEKDPERRFQRPGDLIESLEDAVAALARSGTPPATPTDRPRVARTAPPGMPRAVAAPTTGGGSRGDRAGSTSPAPPPG